MTNFSSMPISGPGEKLAKELERFSFGAAVSPIAEVIPNDGPDNFVRTVVSLGRISIDHAQHPESMQQDVCVFGEEVPTEVADQKFMFETKTRLLWAWIEGIAGPILVPDLTTSILAGTIKSLNDAFDQKS